MPSPSAAAVKVAPRAHAWIISGDTGLSSRTIWGVMMGAHGNDYPFRDGDYPYDPDDFGRCYHLLEFIPEWKPRLSEVAARYPLWGPLVREWDALTAEWEALVEAKAMSAPEMYDHMKRLREEGDAIASQR